MKRLFGAAFWWLLTPPTDPKEAVAWLSAWVAIVIVGEVLASIADHGFKRGDMIVVAAAVGGWCIIGIPLTLIFWRRKKRNRP